MVALETVTCFHGDHSPEPPAGHYGPYWISSIPVDCRPDRNTNLHLLLFIRASCFHGNLAASWEQAACPSQPAYTLMLVLLYAPWVPPPPRLQGLSPVTTPPTLSAWFFTSQVTMQLDKWSGNKTHLTTRTGKSWSVLNGQCLMAALFTIRNDRTFNVNK